jgi:hypothetical protein
MIITGVDEVQALKKQRLGGTSPTDGSTEPIEDDIRKSEAEIVISTLSSGKNILSLRLWN